MQTITTTAANLDGGLLENYRQFYDFVLLLATDDPEVFIVHLDRPKEKAAPAPTAPGDNLRLSDGGFARLTYAEDRCFALDTYGSYR